MRYFYLLVCVILLLSCKKEPQCMPYSEALKKGLHERKTTAFILNNDTIELDYARDQVYKDSIPFCFGYIERGQKEFSDLTQSFLEDYDPENVKAISLFCEGRDICHGDSVSAEDARFIYIGHIDSGNYAAVDFINIKTGKKESHRVSELYATVQIHHLMAKSGIKRFPSIIGIYNSEIGRNRLKNVSLISKSKDVLWHEAHP